MFFSDCFLFTVIIGGSASSQAGQEVEMCHKKFSKMYFSSYNVFGMISMVLFEEDVFFCASHDVFDATEPPSGIYFPSRPLDSPSLRPFLRQRTLGI